MGTLIDEATRKCLALEVDTSITGKRVKSILNKAAFFRDTPEEILTDNGPEFTSNALSEWAYKRRSTVYLLIPENGKPNQNAFIESFNGDINMIRDSA
ncbi:MAG: transposase family protein [Dehalobacter sp. 4CP]|uniref:DDE-type integrase/transposase/recombinase n=1 Tax=Dehalobacter sp. CP TaxID=2594474 RepID=UPI0013CC239F|nr:transposase family protein [Dehalobacter sp. 4CP]